MTDLAGAVFLSKSGLTSLVDRMEDSGLVERTPDPTDRRATLIRLTRVGEEKLAAAQLHHRSVVRRIFTSNVSEDEARVLVGVFTRLIEGIGQEGRNEPV